MQVIMDAMKYFLLPEKGTFYKANMHTHTTVSDGKFTPEEVKAAYMREGYSIVAFTDHEILLPHPELCDENFLALTGVEIALNPAGVHPQYARTYHLNLYPRDQLKRDFGAYTDKEVWLEHSRKYALPEQAGRNYPREYSVKCANEIIALAKKEGFFVSYNHPVWSLQTSEDYAGLKGLWGVEVYNTDCARVGLPDTPQPFDELLRAGERVFPLATDDSHGDRDRFGGYLMVKAEELECDAVIEALEAGNFYATTGPEIYGLTLENGVLHIVCSPVKEIAYSTDRRYACALQGDLCEATFDLNGFFKDSELARKGDAPPYFRVTLHGADGGVAYTRAFFLSEFQKG